MIAVLIAYTSANSTILSVVAYAWSGLGASFGPAIIISLYWRRTTRNGAFAGILTGATTVIVWELLGTYVGGIFTLYSLLPAFTLSALAIYFVSLMSKPPSAEVIEQFDLSVKSI